MEKEKCYICGNITSGHYSSDPKVPEEKRRKAICLECWVGNVVKELKKNEDKMEQE